MTREPFTPAELGTDDESLNAVAAELEDYAQLAHRAPSAMLVRSVMDAVEAEPAPRRGWWATLAAPGGTLRRSIVSSHSISSTGASRSTLSIVFGSTRTWTCVTP